MDVSLNGKRYTGDWVLVQGGSVALLQTYGVQPMTGVAAGPTGRGVGNAILTSPGGGLLRCEFTYSEWSKTGIGVCADEKQDVYDFQIVTP